MSLRSVVLASILLVATVPIAAGPAGATSHWAGVTTAAGEAVATSQGGAVADAAPIRTDVTTEFVAASSSNESVETGVENSTIFRRVEANRSSFVVDLNMSMLTSLFEKGSTFRLVTGGTANGDRVVWFDIGIGYSGGSVLADPLDGFVVRSEMWISFPGL